MANMSYCRFENTNADLQDCLLHVDEKLHGEHEIAARKRLIFTAVKLLEAVGLNVVVFDNEERPVKDEVNDFCEYAQAHGDDDEKER